VILVRTQKALCSIGFHDPSYVLIPKFGLETTQFFTCLQWIVHSVCIISVEEKFLRHDHNSVAIDRRAGSLEEECPDQRRLGLGEHYIKVKSLRMRMSRS
jgi:hypothetical protein